MKILQLVPRIPYPPDTGAKIEYLNFARMLSPQNEIILVGFAESDITEQGIKFLKQFYSQIEIVPLPGDSIIKKIVLGLMSSVPYTMQKYYSQEMDNKLREIVKKQPIEIVRIDQMHLANYDQCFTNIPVVLRKHNIDATIMKRLYLTEKRPHIRFYAKLQWKKLIEYERRTCQRFQQCVMITRDDEKELQSLCPGAKTSVIPCGIDVDKYPVRKKNRGATKRITFLGSMDWLPTEDAMLYFLQEIFPILVRKIPDLQFYMIGKLPSNRVLKLCKSPQIVVTGYVDSVLPYLEETDVFVVPLRIGSGMRIKILEALCMGIPIVSTAIGMEGIEAVPGKDLLVADTPEDFAKAVIHVMETPVVAGELSQHGRQVIQEKYSIPVVGSQWKKLLVKEVEIFKSKGK